MTAEPAKSLILTANQPIRYDDLSGSFMEPIIAEGAPTTVLPALNADTGVNDS